MKVTAHLEEFICFVCSTQTGNMINSPFEFGGVYCHQTCWDEACCGAVDFPIKKISNEELMKISGLDFSYVCYIDFLNANTFWFQNKLHRKDGPAVICSNGTKMWYQHGKRHREDGPASEYVHGIKHWSLDNVEYSEKEHAEEMIKRNK